MKQVLTINDLAVIHSLVNKAIHSHEEMARQNFTNSPKFESIYLPLNDARVQERLKLDVHYQDLLHLKNTLMNINVEVETADIKIEETNNENNN